MLDFVAKLTRTPADMQHEDTDKLRALGFGDVDILNIVEVAAYYAYVNRIADGLGVELEDYAR
jgi:alkylhydroperoxidase family enzyme